MTSTDVPSQAQILNGILGYAGVVVKLLSQSVNLIVTDEVAPVYSKVQQIQVEHGGNVVVVVVDEEVNVGVLVGVNVGVNVGVLVGVLVGVEVSVGDGVSQLIPSVQRPNETGTKDVSGSPITLIDPFLVQILNGIFGSTFIIG